MFLATHGAEEKRRSSLAVMEITLEIDYSKYPDDYTEEQIKQENDITKIFDQIDIDLGNNNIYAIDVEPDSIVILVEKDTANELKKTIYALKQTYNVWIGTPENGDYGSDKWPQAIVVSEKPTSERIFLIK